MSDLWRSGRFAEVTGEDQVASRDDVVAVVEQMLTDLYAHPDEWENPTLASFLEALGRSLTDMAGLYANRGESFPAQPTWKLFAEALVMASGYE